jgi:hypothetical protein
MPKCFHLTASPDKFIYESEFNNDDYYLPSHKQLGGDHLSGMSSADAEFYTHAGVSLTGQKVAV